MPIGHSPYPLGVEGGVRGDPIFVTIFESVFTRPLRAEPLILG